MPQELLPRSLVAPVRVCTTYESSSKSMPWFQHNGQPSNAANTSATALVCEATFAVARVAFTCIADFTRGAREYRGKALGCACQIVPREPPWQKL
eukprot:3894621-Amphidinium_carterae.1